MQTGVKPGGIAWGAESLNALPINQSTSTQEIRPERLILEKDPFLPSCSVRVCGHGSIRCGTHIIRVNEEWEKAPRRTNCNAIFEHHVFHQVSVGCWATGTILLEFINCKTLSLVAWILFFLCLVLRPLRNTI